MSKLRRFAPLLLVLAANVIGFGILFFGNSNIDLTGLYYSAALLGVVLISYAIIVFFSLGDEYLFLIVSMLLTIGIIMLFRLNPSEAIKQIIWFYVGMTGFYIVFLAYRYNKSWDKLIVLYAALAAGLFLITLVLGVRSGGSKNWISVGGYSIQPSEPIKIIYILGLAALFTAPYTENKKNLVLRMFNNQKTRQLIIMAYAYMHLGFLVLQKEWGSALLYFGIYFVLQFVFEGEYWFLTLNLIIAGGGGLLGYKFLSHIQQRVEVWRDPFADPQGLGYQIAQSLYGMASGGFTGTGLGQGNPDLIPVVRSDFIFSAIYEEFGMLGATGVIILFFILVYRSIKISLQVKNAFNKAVALGIGVMFGLQTFIIIGGVTKLIPLTGITLPFMSAGGSSLATSFAAMAVLQAISCRTEELTDDI